MTSPSRSRRRVLRRRLGACIAATIRLVRKPGLALHVAGGAFRAQMALILATLLLIFVVPGVVDGAVNRLYPSKKVLGLIDKQNPRQQHARERVMTTLWLGSGGLVLFLFFLHAPRGLAQGSARSRRLERRADDLRAEDPTRSSILYRKALSLTTHEGRETRLQAKLYSMYTEMSQTGFTQSGGTTMAPTQNSTQFAESVRSPQPSHTRYRIDSELGRGAMGTVYKGADTVLDRTVAIKELPRGLLRDAGFVERFRQEAVALAQLSHPNIVGVFDFVELPEDRWIVLEFVDGGDLSQLLQAHGPLDPVRVIDLAAKMADALGYAHSRGVIHRDFKPANVLLTRDGTPKISDFGLAKLARSSGLTQSGAILGSPKYMSPEQAAGKPADHRADIYAFGITLYELLTGTAPFEGDTDAVLAQHISQKPEDPCRRREDVPAELNRAILCMLGKNPDERPADMTVLAETLGRIRMKPAPRPVRAS